MKTRKELIKLGYEFVEDYSGEYSQYFECWFKTPDDTQRGPFGVAYTEADNAREMALKAANAHYKQRNILKAVNEANKLYDDGNITQYEYFDIVRGASKRG